MNRALQELTHPATTDRAFLHRWDEDIVREQLLVKACRHAIQQEEGDLAGALELGRQAVAVLETTEGARTLAEARELVAKWESLI